MDTAADWIDTGEHDEACPHCQGDGCPRCGGRGLVSAAAPALDAPITADPSRLHEYLVRLAMEAAMPFVDSGLVEEALAERARERMAQAAQVLVAEFDEARSALAGEVTVRQLAEWASSQDVDGRPRIHLWRDSRGWHALLSVTPTCGAVPRITEAVAGDAQDALTMLMAAKVALVTSAKEPVVHWRSGSHMPHHEHFLTIIRPAPTVREPNAESVRRGLYIGARVNTPQLCNGEIIAWDGDGDPVVEPNDDLDPINSWPSDRVTLAGDAS